MSKIFFQSLKSPVVVRCDIHPTMHEHVLIHTNISNIFFKKWIATICKCSIIVYYKLIVMFRHYVTHLNITLRGQVYQMYYYFVFIYFDGGFTKLFKVGCTNNNVHNFSYHFDRQKLLLTITFTFEGPS